MLTLHVNQVQLKAVRNGHSAAFAALLGDGSVVTWGDADVGGDSSAVQGAAARCAADPRF